MSFRYDIFVLWRETDKTHRSFKISLVTRALMKLGITCCANGRGFTLTRAHDDGVDLHQIDRLGPSPMRMPYLDRGKSLKLVFFYHAFVPSTPVQIFALFMPNGIVQLEILDPGKVRQSIPRFESLYQDLLSKKRPDLQKIANYVYPEQLQSRTSYHNREQGVLNSINRILGTMEKKSYTVVLSSVKSLDYMEAIIPKLTNFPVLRMPSTRSAHSIDVFPWQSAVAKKILTRYFNLSTWFERALAHASYFDIPVGHIEDDQPLYFCDVDLARRLFAQDIVLWWSPGEKPDLGGQEEDLGTPEELESPEFVNSGVYSNVCLSVQVRNLAVDAVLQSALVNELEGSGGTTAFDSTTHTIDDYALGEAHPSMTIGDSNLSPQIFATVKQMVRSWLIDKARDTNSPATVTLDHFWRWVSSCSSNMYEPSIQKFIHGLMRKTFIQLLAEFKRLGSNVVYADFSRILLVTSKPPGTAHAYATYINTAVTSNELFKHIYLRTDRFYDFLVFMDQANYGAVVCDDPLAIEPPSQITITSMWNICKFLPLAVHKHFNLSIRYFISQLARIRRLAEDSARTPLRVLNNLQVDITPRNAGKTKEIGESKTFILEKLTRRMLKNVSEIHSNHKRSIIEEGESEEFAFPILPGSHLIMTDPALEFVNFTCAVFGLAQDYQIEVGIMKKNLLELVGEREFSDKAVFNNPCDPLKLSMVTCKFCDQIRDFDFCRDEELFPATTEAVRWFCSECDGEYDRAAIEFALIQKLHRIERNFTQQDLQCARCKQIQSDNISRHCVCSGAYQLTKNKAEIKKKLRTMVNVSIAHNLTRLRVRSSSRDDDIS